MLRVRIYPLRVGSGDSASNGVSNIEDGGVQSGSGKFDAVQNGVGTEEEVYIVPKDKVVEFSRSMTCLNLLHVAQGISFMYGLFLIIALITTIVYERGYASEIYNFKAPLTQTATVWVPYTNDTMHTDAITSSCTPYIGRDFYKTGSYPQHTVFKVDTLNSRYLILSVLFISFMFQALNCIDGDKYYESFMVGNSHIAGYLERSISMPLFVMVLLTQIGVSDVWAIVGLVFNAWAAMLLSFFAEVLFQGDGGFLTIDMRPFSPNSVEDGGGFHLYEKGVVHYHALAMLFSFGQFGLVTGSLLYNDLLVHSCLPSQPMLPFSWAIYIVPVMYGLVLVGQAFVSYVKDKPSTVKSDRKKMIGQWKKDNQYNGTGFTDEQNKNLRNGWENRVKYALLLEFYYLILDVLVKSVILSSLFIFKLN